MPEHLRLTRDLTQPLPEPRWPAGVALADFSATLAPKVHALLRLAYAKGGGSVPADVDGWWAATRHDPEFDAGLVLVAMAGDAPVAVALCWTSAFVKDFVVHPDWQRQGLGKALLLAALRRLAARGHETAALKVETDNARARRLYARLGFRES